jgi:hypothetical protein
MRPEAQVKMGYYPTPPDVVDQVRSFVEYPKDHTTLLDPCCGEGLALSAMRDGQPATTYGIEPDQHRAKAAAKRVDHVLRCGYEDARISNNAFSCLFLNPPYDWETHEAGERSERTEYAFLKGTSRYLQPDGLLVYIVPQQRVTEPVAKYLAYRFQDFDAYRFPDGEYDAFRQIVLFGRKKPKPQPHDPDMRRLWAIPHEQLRELDRAPTPAYGLPPSGEVSLLRSNLVDERELREELRQSRLWGDLGRYGRNGNGRLARPPLPLHAGHLGLLLASGHLDGVVGDGEDRHVVRGKVEKLTQTFEEYEGDAVVERQVERYQVSIKLLTQEGDIITLV